MDECGRESVCLCVKREVDVNNEMSFPDSSQTSVLYHQDNVCVHPGRGRVKLSGRLSLITNCGVLFIAWTPYKSSSKPAATVTTSTTTVSENASSMSTGVVLGGGGDLSEGNSGAATCEQNQNSNGEGSKKGRNLYSAAVYTVQPFPVYDISAISVKTPVIGKPFVIIILSSGLSLPPLYFYAGRVSNFIDTMKSHVSLMRSWEDKNVYLVNDISDPLQRSLMSLELSDVLKKGAETDSSDKGSLLKSGNDTSRREDDEEDARLSSSIVESTMSMLGWI